MFSIKAIRVQNSILWFPHPDICRMGCWHAHIGCNNEKPENKEGA